MHQHKCDVKYNVLRRTHLKCQCHRMERLVFITTLVDMAVVYVRVLYVTERHIGTRRPAASWRTCASTRRPEHSRRAQSATCRHACPAHAHDGKLITRPWLRPRLVRP
ncbi:hypothetical protein EVAR_24188_1 [Eumeta japonica]|uniref:Uncharacterized protein n=1 Tax=Eumeta variegata TaxID=151549 RepID=A0A4C1W773_EUMVA|nr:hypothetical protein EVAR_24188_1 [Eumeta japonica]